MRTRNSQSQNTAMARTQILQGACIVPVLRLETDKGCLAGPHSRAKPLRGRGNTGEFAKRLIRDHRGEVTGKPWCSIR